MEIATAVSEAPTAPADVKTNMATVRVLAAPDINVLQQARDTLTEIRSKFDISTVERNIKALQAASRIQGIDRDLQSRCWTELRKYKLIKEILDSDVFL
jgi:hypothetical protein